MIKKRNSKVQIQSLTILFVIFLTSAYISFSTNFFDSSSASERIGEDIKEDTENAPLNEKPVLSSFGEDPWWNGSFQYRRLINITNPHAEDLEDTIVSITFNYSDYVNDGKMNESLNDVRIIENNVIRNYLIQIDYPNASLATVWFETNLSASSLGQDIYMYYGNNSVNRAALYYNNYGRFGKSWWRLDDGEGTTPEDSIGINDGIFQNSPIWVEGKVGGALDFARSELDHVEMSDFSMGDTYVVAGWLKGGGSGHMPWGLDREGIGGGNDLDTWFVGGYIYNNIGDSYGSPFRDEVSAQVPYPTDGQWHYFVVENIGGSSSTADLWIDGEWAGEATYHNPTATNRMFQLSGWPYDDGYHWTGQIDDVRIFQYDLSAYDVESIYNLTAIPAELNEEQYKGIVETLEITVYDVDGRFVPHAHISLVNMTVPEVVFTGETEDDGSLTFTKIPAGTYNITVKYNDTSSGMEYIAYNSTEENFGTPDDDMYTFTELRHEIDLQVDLWTIDFEIVDWDHNPLGYSYINVSDPLVPGTVIDNIRLVDGKATFRWENATQYYYEIYYDNADYETIPVHLNKSYILRSDYDPAEKIYNQPIIWVNNTNTLLPGADYRVQETIFTNGSTEIGKKKLLKANITLTGMTDSLTFVKICYIDKNGGFGDDNLIYFNDSYSGGQEDFIEINIRNPPEVSNNLIADNFEAYGLYIDVYGYNNTQCNGTIQVLTVEACHIYNITSLAKLQIRVIDMKPGYIPVQSCIVRVENSTGHTITELITDGDGYAYGQINSESEFWFSRVSNAENYTFILNFYGNDKQFEVNVSDQYIPGSFVMNYNYTLKKNTTLVFKIQIDISDYLSKFTDVPGDIAVTWGENMTFSVNYTISEDGGDSWDYLNEPNEIICIVGNDNSKAMIRGVGNGIFIVTFNSSEFSAGDGSEIYWVAISGSKLGYIDPEPVFSIVTIYALPTALSVHDYDTLAIYPNNLTSKYWNVLFNLTVKYQETSGTSAVIRDASLSYDWIYGSGTINPDPIKDGYYTITIDTSVAPAGGQYEFEITAIKENYTKIQDFGFDIIIHPRPTLLNGSTDLLYLSKNVWIEDAYNFTFEYTDTLLGTKVGDLTINYYSWQKLDSNKQPISGEDGVGTLNQTIDDKFILDFDTETKSIGNYYILIQLKKDNYDLRTSIINLEIKKRDIDVNLSATSLKGDLVNVVKGTDIIMTIDLNDPTKNDILLIGATVKLTIGANSYEFEEVEDGKYELTFETDDYNTFFASQTLTGDITIEKENYETETLDITFVIGMEEFPFLPGIPAFYLIMIVGAIIAVVGSLVTYRQILRARIPKFVKKVREMSKNIKGRKDISDSLLYPSKEEYMVKILGDKWEMLGLSLEEILGIGTRKVKKLPQKTEIEGGGT